VANIVHVKTSNPEGVVKKWSSRVTITFMWTWIQDFARYCWVESDKFFDIFEMILYLYFLASANYQDFLNLFLKWILTFQ